MKVLTGVYKGVPLATPENEQVRPTVDHFKKHILRLFDQVKPQVAWDLFAGSGGVGVEFLSMGAKQVVFVDQLSAALQCLRLNLGECRMKDPVSFGHQISIVLQTTVENFLRRPEDFKSHLQPPQLVFLDPPYGQGLMKKIAPLLLSHPLITPSCLILAEHVVEDPIENIEPLGKLESQEIYGPKVLSRIRKAPSQ